MGAARFFVRLCAAAVVAAAALAVTGVAGAASGASLSIQVFPSTLLSGGAGAVLATFTNSGASTLNHVVLTVDLDGATFDSAGSSSGCTASASIVTCTISPVGGILTGAVVKTTIAFTGVPVPVPADAPLTFNGTATWASPNSGKPNGTPVPRNTVSASATANVVTVANASSSCKPGGDTLTDQNNGGQVIGVTAGGNTLGLTCTPIIAGIDDGGILFTKLPPLATPATVTLTFPDETLPNSIDNPNPLTEYPNYPDTSTSVTVPNCDPGPAIPSGSDSCIVSVDTSADTDEDADAGTMTLLVQGSLTGDPGYH